MATPSAASACQVTEEDHGRDALTSSVSVLLESLGPTLLSVADVRASTGLTGAARTDR